MNTCLGDEHKEIAEQRTGHALQSHLLPFQVAQNTLNQASNVRAAALWDPFE